MMLRNNNLRYGLVSRLLHWIVVVLVFTQFIIGITASGLPLGIERLVWLSRHKSIGMTVLMLVAVRLVWRFMNPAPPLPEKMPRYEKNLAHTTHWLFYGLLLCMPVAGWINSSASNLTVSWFGLFNWPDLVAPNRSLASVAKETHEILGWVFLALIALHVFAAVRHHFILKDDILTRMLPGFGRKPEVEKGES